MLSMRQITSIKIQKNGRRANIYLDGKYEFGISVEDLSKQGLSVGQKLSKQKVEELKQRGETHKHYLNLIKFVSLRPRSVKEVQDWMRRKKIEERDRSKLFSKVNRYVRVDDKEFSRWWVRQRISFRPRSKQQLLHELYQKGIDKRVAEEAIEDSDFEEEEMARSLLEKYLKRLKKSSGQDLYKKSVAYLARQGFNRNVVENVIDHMLTKR